MSAVVVALLLAASGSTPARAQSCDIIAGAEVCNSSTSELQDTTDSILIVNEGDDVKPTYQTSPGADLGTSIVRRIEIKELPEDRQVSNPGDQDGEGGFDIGSDEMPAVSKGTDEAREEIRELAELKGLDTTPLDDPRYNFDDNWAVLIPRSWGHADSFSRQTNTNEADSEQAGDDPVNHATGEFTIDELDLELPGVGVDFRFTRTYRSQIEYSGAFGPSWTHNYERRVFDPEPRMIPATTGWMVLPGERILVSSGRGTTAMFEYAGAEEHGGSAFGAQLDFIYRMRGRPGIKLVARYTLPPNDVALVAHEPLQVTRSDLAAMPFSWELSSPAGETSHFDSEGYLLRIEDRRGNGLQFEWEHLSSSSANLIDRPKRLVRVTDALGRVVDFHYNQAGLLESVEYAAASLAATYRYDESGALSEATTAYGRLERYEYDSGHIDEYVDEFIPDMALQAACSYACGTPDDLGQGACVDAANAAVEECKEQKAVQLGVCEQSCSSECKSLCEWGPDDGSEPGCRALCGAECTADYAMEICESLWNDDGPGAELSARRQCRTCEGSCEQSCGMRCNFFALCGELSALIDIDAAQDGGAGSEAPQPDPVFDNEQDRNRYDEIVTEAERLGILDVARSCRDFLSELKEIGRIFVDAIVLVAKSIADVACYISRWFGSDCKPRSAAEHFRKTCSGGCYECCKEGDKCARDSCNRGRGCKDECGDAFWGRHDDQYSALCSATYNGGGCPAQVQQQCGTTCTDNCVSNCRWGCTDDCREGCRSSQNYLYWDAICEGARSSLTVECQPICVDSCVQQGRIAPDEPRYGYRTDLNHNILRVYSGRDKVPYLINEYGTEPTDIAFDRVTVQRFGEHPTSDRAIHFDYRDLFAEHRGLAEPPGPGSRAAEYVTSFDDFVAVDICSRDCVDSGSVGLPVIEAIPWGDVLVTFDSNSGASAAPPVRPLGAGQTTGSAPLSIFEIRVSTDGQAFAAPTVEWFDYSGVAFELELESGAAQFFGGPAGLAIEGSRETLAELELARHLTVVTDNSGVLRATPSVPINLLHLSNGYCLAPFSVVSDDANGVLLEPADACADSLTIAPLATVAELVAADLFVDSEGQASLLRDVFLSTPLSPNRGVVELRRDDGGHFSLTQEANAGVESPSFQSAVASVAALAPSTSALVTTQHSVTPNAQPTFLFHTARSPYSLDGLRLGGSLPTVPGTGPGTIDPTPTPGPTPTPSPSPFPGPVTIPFPDFEPEVPVPPPPTTPPGTQTNFPALPPVVVLEPGREPACELEMPGRARRGRGELARGPLPARATVVTDSEGVVRTYYYDKRGLKLRSVNHETAAVESFNYDSAGFLTAVEQPEGGRLCFARDTLGNQVETLALPAPGRRGPRDPIVVKAEFLEGTNLPLQVFDPLAPESAAKTYSYNEFSELTSIVNAAGHPTVLVRDALGRVEETRTCSSPMSPGDCLLSADANVSTFDFDDVSGQPEAVSMSAPGSETLTTSMLLDAAGRPLSWTNPTGMTSVWGWDGGQLQSMQTTGGGVDHRVAFAYDAGGHLLRETTADGVVHHNRNVKDRTGRHLYSQFVPASGDEAPSTTCTLYSSNGLLKATADAEGRRTYFRHDGAGRVVDVYVGAPDADVAALISDRRWESVCGIDPRAALGGGPQNRIAHYEYSRDGELLLEVDVRGNETRHGYDGFGQRIWTQQPDGVTHHAEYDSLGRVKRVWVTDSLDGGESADSELLASEVDYDQLGRVVARRSKWFDDGGPIESGWVVERWVYDDAERTVTHVDREGNATTATLDGLGRLIEARDAAGHIVTKVYEDKGRKVITTTAPAPTPQGQRQEVVRRTPWGAVEALETTDLGQARTTVRYEHDERGRLRALVNVATGYRREYAYDAYGRIDTEIHDFGGGQRETVSFDFYRDGRIRTRTSDIGLGPALVSGYRYDELGRLQRKLRPDGGETSYEYLGLSSLVDSSTDSSGSRLGYGYDVLGRVDYVGGIGLDGHTVGKTFAYDGLGRVLSASSWYTAGDITAGASATVESSLRWDSLGNLVHESTEVSDGPTLPVLTHAYDAMGRPTYTELSGVDGLLGRASVHRVYDELGRLEQLSLNERSVSLQPTSSLASSAYQYAGLGGPTSVTRSNGVATLLRYDDLGRLVEQRDETNGYIGNTTVSALAYGIPFDGVPRSVDFQMSWGNLGSYFDVDAAARVVGEVHRAGGAHAVSLSAGDSFATAAAVVAPQLNGNSLRTYELDARHNWRKRIASNENGGVLRPEIGSDDRYLSTGGPDFSFDPEGRLTWTDSESLEYDLFGRVVRIRTDASDQWLAYDAFDRLVRRETPRGDIETFGWSGQQRLVRRRQTEGAESSDLLTVPSVGLDRYAFQVNEAGDVHYVHQDRTNSPYMVTDLYGQPVEFHQYTAFGEQTIYDNDGVVVSNSPSQLPYGFQGQRVDTASGLVDMRARYYKPQWGRFVSPDPIGFAGGSNRYAFVSGATLSFTDPLGLFQFGVGNQPRLVRGRCGEALQAQYHCFDKNGWFGEALMIEGNAPTLGDELYERFRDFVGPTTVKVAGGHGGRDPVILVGNRLGAWVFAPGAGDKAFRYIGNNSEVLASYDRWARPATPAEAERFDHALRGLQEELLPLMHGAQEFVVKASTIVGGFGMARTAIARFGPRLLAEAGYPATAHVLGNSYFTAAGLGQTSVAGVSLGGTASAARLSTLGDDVITFFHGTNAQGAASIRSTGINLARGRPNTDFGRGFYMSESRAVAESAARRLYGEAAEVVEIRVSRAAFEALDNLSFPGATREWADFVRFQRTFEPEALMHGGRTYDSVSGPLWRRFSRSGDAVAWPTGSQTSIHTERAVELFNQGIVR